jgi:hypothetical protein
VTLQKRLFWEIALFAVCVRILLLFVSPTIVDVDAYYTVGSLVSFGKNIYQHNAPYNYAPLWSFVLGGVYSLTHLFHGDIHLFRFFVTIILSVVDIGIAYFLFTKKSKLLAFLFLFNPVSLITTGTHGQFDSIAILFGLLAAQTLDEGKNGKRTLWQGILFLSLSLLVKHIFILLPFWWALKEKTWIRRILVFSIPLVIFCLSFVPYLPAGFVGINERIIVYRGQINTLFWQLFIPFPLQQFLSPFTFFVLVLFVAGFLVRKTSHLYSLCFYGLIMVIVSPSLVNNYFLISVPFALLNFNIFFAGFFFFYTFIFILSRFSWVWYTPILHLPVTGASVIYFPLVAFLFAGLLYAVLQKKHLFSSRKAIRICIVGIVVSVWIVGARAWEYSTILPIEKNIREGRMDVASRQFSVIHANPPIPGTLYYFELLPVWDRVETYQRTGK